MRPASAVRLLGRDLEADWGFAGLDKLPQSKPQALRHVLAALVERIELDPEPDPRTKKRDFKIHSRLPTGAKVASPRGFGKPPWAPRRIKDLEKPQCYARVTA